MTRRPRLPPLAAVGDERPARAPLTLGAGLEQRSFLVQKTGIAR